MFRKLVSVILSVLLIQSIIAADYYSSISGLETLLEIEKFYLESLEEHVQELEKFGGILISLLNEIEGERNQTHTSDYLEGPMNAFKTLRRIAVDWEQAKNLVNIIQNVTVFSNSSILEYVNITLPTMDDLNGAARGMSRLQKMYKLDAASIAKGYLKGQKYSRPMSAFSCFVMAERLYESQDFHHASEWLIEALHRVEVETKNEVGKFKLEFLGDHDKWNNQSRGFMDHYEELRGFPYISEVEILQLLGLALFKAGSLRLAMTVNSKLLEIDPQNPHGLAHKDLFERAYKQVLHERIPATPTEISKVMQTYEQVCSGELQQTPQEKRHLRCRYATNNLAYYLLGPLKLEELNFDPFIAYYHKAIHDREIEQIIKNVQGSIERSQIGSLDDYGVDEYRISKNSWLSFEEYEFLGKLSQRLEDITGLSLETGESLQVANYGIGGHYGTHFDFSEDGDDDFEDAGNRILTAMFYINDVELGGATAFPLLRLAVPPIKGSLVVWYNMHKSLELDFRTAHAGCPVLKGSKWIVNEWFHAVGQELRRPCDLKADGEVSKQYQYYLDHI